MTYRTTSLLSLLNLKIVSTTLIAISKLRLEPRPSSRYKLEFLPVMSIYDSETRIIEPSLKKRLNSFMQELNYPEINFITLLNATLLLAVRHLFKFSLVMYS